MTCPRPLGASQGRAAPTLHRRAWCAASRHSCGVSYVLCDSAEHFKEGHPESPERIHAIRQALLHQQANDDSLCDKVVQLHSTRDASAAELELVHPPAYVQRMWEICGGLKETAMVDDATYLTAGSMATSVRAVGCTLDLTDHVINHGTCGFALVRPPGHHVLPSRPMGFGLLNNVSIATRYAQRRHGMQRCMIFDFDVHHGNGTMEVFWEDPSVLYISLHQANLWPYTGKDTNRGAGAGAGTTINIPLPGGAGDEAICSVFERVVLPAAQRFQPDMIICSAGYDAHWRDPLAGLQLNTWTYRCLARQLARLAHTMCGGRLLLVLEGGYHQQSLAESVVATFRGLLQGQDDAHASTDSFTQGQAAQPLGSDSLIQGQGQARASTDGLIQGQAVQANERTQGKDAHGFEPASFLKGQDNARPFRPDSLIQGQDKAYQFEPDSFLPGQDDAHALGTKVNGGVCFSWPSPDDLHESELEDLQTALPPEPHAKVQQVLDKVVRLHGL